MEIVDELGVELAGRPLGLGAPDVLVVDEELDGVHEPVDGIDPPRREARRSGADAFDDLRPWSLGDPLLDLLGVAGERLHQHPRSRVGTPLAHHEVSGKINGPPTAAQRRCVWSELVEELAQLVPLDARRCRHANHGTEFTSVPSGVSIGFMRLPYVVGRPKGGAMRRVATAVTAALIATSAVALTSVSDISAVAPPDATVFISEIHYDNAGVDAGEAIEVFGPAGTDLTGWSIVLYNGAERCGVRHRSVVGTDP